MGMEEKGQVAFTDSAERARLDTDPMYKLEKGKEDKTILEDRKPALRKLQIESAVKSGDNFELNRALRAGLRYAKQLDEAPLDDERTFARVLATTKITSQKEKQIGTLSGQKRTLSRSKLGIQKKI